MKLIKKVLLIIFILIVTLISGLIINNRIFYSRYSKVDVMTETLPNKDIERIVSVYEYLKNSGNDIYEGFGADINLIIYNRKFEFLFSDNKYSDEWTSLGYNEKIGKNIYRRDAVNPQAFATKLNSEWVGSFNTKDYFNIAILEEVPIIMPPQSFALDEIAYRSVVIHEMVHAFQGNCDSNRVDKVGHIHNICSDYNGKSEFNKLLKDEGKILEKAIKETDKDILISCVKEFLEVRDKRRNSCHMTSTNITNEKEMEWDVMLNI